MKTLLTYIFTLLFFVSFGQELTSIKVSVPDTTDEVYIVGNQDALGNWEPDKIKMKKISDREREIELKLTFPAEFKFTRGSWDKEGIMKSLSDNPNLRILDERSETTFTVKTWMDNIESDKLGLDYDIKYIESKLMGDKRMFYVYLPDNYTPEKKYPVIYMTDGSTDNFQVAKSYINALSQGSFNIIPESILVSIVHKNRNEELYNVNSGAHFTEYLFQELVPFIDSNYSTSGFNAMIGHSNGAEYNHMLLLHKDNPFRGFISLSTSFISKPECKEELTGFFERYKGKKIYNFIANATLDSPDRIEAGNTFESLYQSTPNAQIKFSKQTYQADHITIVPNALIDGLKLIFYDYNNMEAYPTVVDYGENYLANIEQNYGIKGHISRADLEGYYMDIINNKNKEHYEYSLALFKEHKLWNNGGFDPVNIANGYYLMGMYPETIEAYNQSFQEFERVEPMVFYANISKAVESYQKEGKITDGIAFLEKSRETLSKEYYLGVTYHIAKLSLDNKVEVEKGREALEYCKANYRKNRHFTEDDLVVLEEH